MSTKYVFHILAICLLLSLSPLGITMAGRVVPPSAPSTITRPLVSEEAETYSTMKPQLDHKQGVFRRREVKGCLPKGFRHSSAPSRFVNYDQLGSNDCSSGMHSRKP
ncbi:Maintenance of mitochondrial morphology protein like [Quillaja saponaria]|uniref:Maintenance of mitochondrial morphology protein like n=1 Tax=Quillaja saponaria TaxID=32244 RepID=A0AAD7QGU3_QUISA|nr:Maintenance of mitochondrial morphology protein like [Quillaja saponaria]